MSTNKEQYARLCSETADMPLFLQHWWLQCVCAGKRWDVWLMKDTDGSILAAMPYLYRKRLWGVPFIVQPTHTQLGGVWLSDKALNDSDIQRRVVRKMTEFIKGLGVWYYYQQYCIDSPLVPLLGEAGFTLKKRLTYRLDDVSDMDAVTENCSKNKRRQFLHAKDLIVRRDMEPEEFYKFHSATLMSRNREISYTREYFLVLYNHAIRRGQGAIISLHDNDGQTLAALFTVWDDKRLYYLIPAFDINKKESGASARMALEAIRFASEKQLAFDFEGSMIPGVAKHYKQYGTTPVYYYGVEKVYNPLFRLFRWLYRLKNRKKV